MEPYFKITKYSHFFSVTNIKPDGLSLLLKFSVRYVQKTFVREGGKNVLKPTKVFAGRVGSDEFRFHIGQYDDFIKFLLNLGFTHDYFTVDVAPLYIPATYDYVVNPKYEEREYQRKIIDFLVDSDINDNRSRMVGLYTGGGKGVVSLSAISKLKTRAMVIILPKYGLKWCKEITEVLDVKPEEVLYIQGNKDLRSLMHLSIEEDIQAKFIVVSLTTIQNLYNDFKEYGDDITSYGYPYKPEDMFKHLKIGAIIFDEVHQHLHGVFKVLLHTHVPKVIALSATLMSDDLFINNMQHIMFPKEIRYTNVQMKKYIKVRVFSYSFKDFNTIKKIRTTARGSNVYSHIEFEKSIMRNKGLLNNYLNLIDKLLHINFLDTYTKGDKAIIFAASIAMCNEIVKYLKNKFPSMDIRRYVEDDPYENVIDAEIRVSTILSSGTAVDIPNLTTAIMTNSIQSPVANLQALGRLREIKDKDVTFCYIYNKQIPKQVDYHFRKKELFNDRIASLKEYAMPEGI